MNCRFDAELLTGYTDGALDASERRAVEQHIAGCPDCLRILEDLKGAVQALHSLPRAAAPASIAEAVRRETRSSAPAGRPRFRGNFLMAAAAAMLVAVSVSIILSEPRPGRNQDMARAASVPSPSPLAPMKEEWTGGAPAGEPTRVDLAEDLAHSAGPVEGAEGRFKKKGEAQKDLESLDRDGKAENADPGRVAPQELKATEEEKAAAPRPAGKPEPGPSAAAIPPPQDPPAPPTDSLTHRSARELRKNDKEADEPVVLIVRAADPAAARAEAEKILRSLAPGEEAGRRGMRLLEDASAKGDEVAATLTESEAGQLRKRLAMLKSTTVSVAPPKEGDLRDLAKEAGPGGKTPAPSPSPDGRFEEDGQSGGERRARENGAEREEKNGADESAGKKSATKEDKLAGAAADAGQAPRRRYVLKFEPLPAASPSTAPKKD